MRDTQNTEKKNVVVCSEMLQKAWRLIEFSFYGRYIVNNSISLPTTPPFPANFSNKNRSVPVSTFMNNNKRKNVNLNLQKRRNVGVISR